MVATTLTLMRTARRARDVQLIGSMYCRASKDKHGRQISVDSQERVGLEFFDEFGIKHYATYVDNDISGSPFGTEIRDKYEQALDDLRSGRSTLLWTFDSSRAQRDLEVYGKLRRICIETGAFFAYDGRIYDMRDPADCKATARDAVDAETTAYNISIGVRRGVKERAARGEHAGPKAYGYRSVYSPTTGRLLGREVDEDEKLVIRMIVDWLLESATETAPGKALEWVAARLNKNGIPTPQFGRWNATLVKRVHAIYRYHREWLEFLARLTPEDRQWAEFIALKVEGGERPKDVGRALNAEGVLYFDATPWTGVKVKNIALSEPAAGLRVFQGEIVARKQDAPDAPDGFRVVPVEVKWDAIITPEERAQLLAVLTKPPRESRKHPERVKYLWTGGSVCGECGGIVTRRVRGTRAKYTCKRKACFSHPEGMVDDFLVEHGIQLLEREDAAQLFRLDQDANASAKAQVEAAKLRAELDGWRRKALAKEITPESFVFFEGELLEKLKKQDELAVRASLPPELAKVIGPNAREVFLSLPVHEKRKILHAIMKPKFFPASKRQRDTEFLEHDKVDPGVRFELPTQEPEMAVAA